MSVLSESYSPSKSFYWDDGMDVLFQKSKDEIISLVKEGVKTFVPNRLVKKWNWIPPDAKTKGHWIS